MTEGTSAKRYFDTILAVQALDEDSVIFAKQVFDEYSKTGVFVGSDFEDDVWQATDEYSNVGIHFNFNKMLYKKYYEPILNLVFEEFVKYVKVFVTMTLGKMF